jgi:hypothetical protein
MMLLLYRLDVCNHYWGFHGRLVFSSSSIRGSTVEADQGYWTAEKLVKEKEKGRLLKSEDKREISW